MEGGAVAVGGAGQAAQGVVGVGDGQRAGRRRGGRRRRHCLGPGGGRRLGRRGRRCDCTGRSARDGRRGCNGRRGRAGARGRGRAGSGRCFGGNRNEGQGAAIAESDIQSEHSRVEVRPVVVGVFEYHVEDDRARDRQEVVGQLGACPGVGRSTAFTGIVLNIVLAACAKRPLSDFLGGVHKTICAPVEIDGGEQGFLTSIVTLVSSKI